MKVTQLISSMALLTTLVLATPAGAQQPVPAAPQAGAASNSSTAGPRLAPDFPRAEPTLARSSTSTGSSLAAASGQQTIVVSTLVLVLAAIIIVLLIT